VDVDDGGASVRRVDRAAAISVGVTAQCGLLVTLVSSPVIAQVIITSVFIRFPSEARSIILSRP
jgi:hypothetical protein